MIYNRHSVVGAMLWIRYGLGAGHPRRSLVDIYAHNLESPGTKAFTVDEATEMASMFSTVSVRPQITFGDLLEGAVGQQHRGRMLDWAKRVWPRSLIRRLLPKYGLALLIEAEK